MNPIHCNACGTDLPGDRDVDVIAHVSVYHPNVLFKPVLVNGDLRTIEPVS